MEVVVLILKIYFVFVIFAMVVYAVRHFVFVSNRMFGEQRIYYQDILDSELPSVSVFIPMHNEEDVAAACRSHADRRLHLGVLQT